MVLFKLVLLTGSIYHFLEIYVMFKEWISCSHPWDNDANSTQHPTWRQAVSEEFDSAVYDLLMGLWCFGASKYWGKSMNNYVVETRRLKWMNKWVFNAWNNALMLGGNYFHSASPVNFHPASWQKIQLSYPTFRSIPQLHITPIE